MCMFCLSNFHFSQTPPLSLSLSSLSLWLSFYDSDENRWLASKRRLQQWETFRSRNLAASIALPWPISTQATAILSPYVAHPSSCQSFMRNLRSTRSEPFDLISRSKSDRPIKAKRTPALEKEGENGGFFFFNSNSLIYQ